MMNYSFFEPRGEMKMKKILSVKAISLPLCLLGAAALVSFSAQVRSGVQEGLSICGETLIPSLFLFLCLCNIAVEYSAQPLPGFSLLYSRLFHLPAQTAALFLLAMLGGYPIGPMLAARLLEMGAITPAQAQRLPLFCCASGPAFCILAVGEGMCRSKSIGYILYAACLLAQITLGLVLSLFWRKKEDCKVEKFYKEAAPFSAVLCRSVESATSAMLGICAYVILFNVLLHLLSLVPISESALDYCGALLEVTTGCLRFREQIPALAAILGWGGFSVFFQIKKYLLLTGTKSGYFLLARAAAALLSFAYCLLLMRLFHPAIPTLAPGMQFKAVSYSAPLSAALVLCTAAFVLDNKRGKLLSN